MVVSELVLRGVTASLSYLAGAITTLVVPKIWFVVWLGVWIMPDTSAMIASAVAPAHEPAAPENVGTALALMKPVMPVFA